MRLELSPEEARRLRAHLMNAMQAYHEAALQAPADARGQYSQAYNDAQIFIDRLVQLQRRSQRARRSTK